MKSGDLKGLATTNPERNPELPDVPTLKEQGIDVEFVNWRGLMAAPGISDAQRQALVKAVSDMVKSDGWKATVKKNEWLDLYMGGDAFKTYIEAERSIGASDWTIIVRHILPGTISSIVVYFSMRGGTREILRGIIAKGLDLR